VVCISLQLKARQSIDHPSHRISYNYQLADCDSFRDLLRDAPWSDIFALPVENCAAEIAFVSYRKYQVRPHSTLWFSPVCAAAIAHCNHFFHLFRRDNSDEDKRLLLLVVAVETFSRMLRKTIRSL